MKKGVFTNEHLQGVYAQVRSERQMAEANLELAKLREMVMDLVEAGGSVMHSTFVSGGEPKWRHPSERESFMRLNEVLHEAFKTVAGVSA